MDDYKELIEQLRKGFGSAAGRATQVNFYHMWCHKAADAIASLLAENERLKDELAKYRDAPVVAYLRPDGSVSKLFCSTDYKLIVKPGEEK